MNVQKQKQKQTTAQFSEIEGTGVFISIKRADHHDSMSLLHQNGLRPMTYQEALVFINRNPELKEQSKDKWFYLYGNGTELSELYTFNEEGQLTKGSGNIEKTVYVWKGGQPLSLPLSLFVLTDDVARVYGRRFSLYANCGPEGVATMVAGVRANHEAAILENAHAVSPRAMAPASKPIDPFRSVHRTADPLL